VRGGEAAANGHEGGVLQSRMREQKGSDYAGPTWYKVFDMLAWRCDNILSMQSNWMQIETEKKYLTRQFRQREIKTREETQNTVRGSWGLAEPHKEMSMKRQLQVENIHSLMRTMTNEELQKEELQKKRRDEGKQPHNTSIRHQGRFNEWNSAVLNLKSKKWKRSGRPSLSERCPEVQGLN
jgi:hypothetical protein